MLRFFVITNIIFFFACTSSAPGPSLGDAQGASCVQNLDCSQGLFCLCQRCIAQETQIYPSHCPHLELVSCDTSNGQCTDDCEDKTSIFEAECIENLWFCPENSQLVQLCEDQLTDLDASIP